MQSRPHHLFFHRTRADPINRCDFALLHILQPEEHEYVACALTELIERGQNVCKRFLSE
jgi:hypothetical protein